MVDWKRVREDFPERNSRRGAAMLKRASKSLRY